MRKLYPSYKDIEVEWIGKIPSHWTINKLKYILKKDGFRSGPFGSSLITNKLAESGNYLIYSPEYLTEKIIEYPLYVPLQREEELLKYLIKEGDIALPIVGTLGRAKLFTKYDKEGILNQRLCRITPNPDKIFVHYLLKILIDTQLIKVQIDIEKKGSILDHITREIIINLIFPYPPISEQRQIISYLDNKIKIIDELVDETKQKIELLKEKRTSLINHCVIKGLNPDIKMKDSGVGWIGKIPVDWAKTKLSYYCEIKDGTHDTPLYVDEGGIPLVTQKDISGGKLNFSKTKNISYEDYKQINLRSNVVKDDIIMSMIGSIGNPTIVNVNTPFSIKNVCLFKTSDSQENTKFIYYLLSSDVLNTELIYNSRGGVQGFVSLDVLRNLLFVKPPISEQQQIVDYLDLQTQKIDTLIDKENKRIELLKEYRQSLISEAATGKIDVRDEVVV